MARDAREGGVRLPYRQAGPLRTMGRRVTLALAAVLVMTLAVVADRGGYRDGVDGEVSVLDAVYYATVSLSTTGYGDIVPVSDAARLVNVVVILPLRLFFLALLVGTTFEVLTQRTREQWRLSRWRSTLRGHTVVVGYGTKGRAAISTLRRSGDAAGGFVVIDPSPGCAEEATDDGVAVIVGDATRSSVLRQAGVESAARVIVAVARDDAATLVTLSVRQLNPTAPVAVAVREAENVPLLRQSGATTVITSSDAAGRLLGLSAHSPAAGQVVGDLLVQDHGLDLVDRAVRDDEVGAAPGGLADLVLAVVRDEKLFRYSEVTTLAAGDRLVIVQSRP
jgi:voltage-gated potassium channel